MAARSSEARIQAEDMRREMRRVTPEDDEVVVIYSGIWMFGSLLGVPIPRVSSYLIELILEALGPQRTVLFPAYTYAYARAREFDLTLSQPETGALPLEALSRTQFRRTRSPLNSYLVTGPRSDEVLSIEDETLWGDHSLMGWFDRVDARIWVLGEPWHEACTHYHRAEEILRVPYRYFKRFPGVIKNRGETLGKVAPVMYVRPLHCAMQRDFTAPAAVMARRGLILASQHEDFLLESARASDIVRVCLELLEADPYAYIRNKDRLRDWVETEKDAEIRALKPEERDQRS